MRVLSVGGGSGGHVTPVLAVLHELRRLDPQAEALFVCDKKFVRQARLLMEPAGIDVRTVASGKLRRYHGVAWWKQLLDLPTTLQNLRDSVLVAIGAIQSVWLLRSWKPDVVFAKGGFVSLPVGFAAHMLKIPLVIHDSDAHPGLTNRVLSRWASQIATGAPLENYTYPKDRTHYVGIPIDRDFRPFTKDERKKARTALGFPDIARPLVVVTGGGLGARCINEAIVRIAPGLIEAGMSILHISGAGEFKRIERVAPESVHYHLVPFVSEGMSQALGAADVVVTRAGATTLLELAALHQAVIIVPNAQLTGGHQVKNAAVYANVGAAEVVDEMRFVANPDELKELILAIATDEQRQKKLGDALAAFAKPDAALDTAQLVVTAAMENERS